MIPPLLASASGPILERSFFRGKKWGIVCTEVSGNLNLSQRIVYHTSIRNNTYTTEWIHRLNHRWTSLTIFFFRLGPPPCWRLSIVSRYPITYKTEKNPFQVRQTTGLGWWVDARYGYRHDKHCMHAQKKKKRERRKRSSVTLANTR